MMLDKQNTLSDMQTIAAVASTIVSTNAIDLGAAATDTVGNSVLSDAGRSRAELLVQVTETVASAGAATVQAQIITSASANLGTPTVVGSSEVIALATLVAGYQFRVGLNPGVLQRYLGCQYIIGTATTTAGKVTAGIVDAKQTTFIG